MPRAVILFLCESSSTGPGSFSPDERVVFFAEQVAPAHWDILALQLEGGVFIQEMEEEPEPLQPVVLLDWLDELKRLLPVHH